MRLGLALKGHLIDRSLCCQIKTAFNAMTPQDARAAGFYRGKSPATTTTESALTGLPDVIELVESKKPYVPSNSNYTGDNYVPSITDQTGSGYTPSTAKQAGGGHVPSVTEQMGGGYVPATVSQSARQPSTNAGQSLADKVARMKAIQSSAVTTPARVMTVDDLRKYQIR